MRILSRFVDYYDHVAHMYGGGDPLIVYKRDGDPDQRDIAVPAHLQLMVPRYEVTFKGNVASMDYVQWPLIVCGRMYILQRPRFEDREPTVYAETDKERAKRLAGRAYTGEGMSEADEQERLMALSRFVGRPVFEYLERHLDRDREEGFVLERTPRLGKMGFAKIMPPDQLYQEISYWVANVCRVSPDETPTTPVSNMQKLEAHGFDRKTSFRHPVNTKSSK